MIIQKEKMTQQEFKARLRNAGISLAEFARQVGIYKQSISKWKNSGVPSWAVSWLKQAETLHNIHRLANTKRPRKKRAA